ncbi:16950_t:CDS:2 [Gigaspora margarita]|uniref:16950_t:CDS:1 n=1 Tax=Gigaspora margarita TaxID=4874 RepID=A0ABM8VZA7_GIGMA|nr:16950_t:CDS:2 [Gigaspora margarita]
MDSTFFADIANDYKKLYETKEILHTRSAYFHSIFSSNWAEKTKDVINLQVQNGAIILELLIATNELKIQKLMDHIQEFFIKYCYDFMKQDSVKVLHVVTRNEAFSELKKVSLETIYKEQFITKVWPFRRLFPDNWVENINTHFL